MSTSSTLADAGLCTLTEAAVLMQMSERTAYRRLRTDPKFPQPVAGLVQRLFRITEIETYRRLRPKQRAA